ncbi:helix-turn-helix domain-containing protein [Halorussus halophilus]|uniref:helix-turn-helix domain-containing protein n=1 Tax=Halorussus halophilus TaxID=2650975 RepID=UPI001787B8B6|nr:helix-turn-helix domain-containing protein [Halorussus halophilus]
MVIAEFTIDHPVLFESLNRVPDIEIEWQETYQRPDGPTQMLFWIESDDFDRVDRTLDDEPAVTNPTVLARTGDRRFYRVDFTNLGEETNLMPQLIEVGGVLRKAVGTNDGWECQARFPDRQAIERVYRFCTDHDIEFTVERLYEETDWSQTGVTLTEAQRETLVEAVESGYLDIPRRCSLANLAERLGISDSAASERFRRGVKELVQQTIPLNGE